jgi:hypothetical protein
MQEGSVTGKTQDLSIMMKVRTYFGFDVIYIHHAVTSCLLEISL